MSFYLSFIFVAFCVVVFFYHGVDNCVVNFFFACCEELCALLLSYPVSRRCVHFLEQLCILVKEYEHFQFCVCRYLLYSCVNISSVCVEISLECKYL